MADINANTHRGLQRDGTSASEYNRLSFAVEQQLQNSVSTAWIGRIDECSNADEVSGSGTVGATQMVAQSDAEGNSLPMASIPAMPYARYQHGIAAVIIDPVPGDLMAFISSKQDISGVNADTKEPQPAGSYRKFDQADSVAVGAVHTKAPEVYIWIKQDKTIYVKAPEGYTLETDADVSIKAGGTVTIDAAAVKINSDVTVSGDVTAGDISLRGHTHPGVDRGDGNTDPPV